MAGLEIVGEEEESASTDRALLRDTMELLREERVATSWREPSWDGEIEEIELSIAVEVR